MGNTLVIAITGTPGIGKSTFAKELSDALPNSKIIEINDIVDQFKLFSRIDRFGSKVVRLKELNEKMRQQIAENKDSNIIIVGHLVPELKLKQDITIVLRIGLKELIRRLEARKYQKEKIRENIVAESIDYCGVKSRESCKETYEVETEDERNKVLGYIANRESGRKAIAPEIREISKLDELLELVADGNKYNL